MSHLDELRATLRGGPATYAAHATAYQVVNTPPGALTADLPAVTATRADPIAHYAAVWSLYHARGARAAAEEARAGRTIDSALPAEWQANLRFIEATAELLAGPERLLLSEDPGRAPTTGAVVALAEHLSLLHVIVLVDGNRARFALDTGAPTTVVSATFATRAGVRVAPDAARAVGDGSGGILRATPAVASELQVGGLARRPAAMTMLNLPPQLDLDGLLSPWDFGRDLDVVVDASGRTLQLRPPYLAGGEAGTVLPLRWVEGTPRAAISAGPVPGIRAWALLDSGAVGDVLCEHLAKRIGYEVGETAPALAAGGEVTVRRTRPLRLQLGRQLAEDRTVVVKECLSDPAALVEESPDLILGLPWFRTAPLSFPARRDTLRIHVPKKA